MRQLIADIPLDSLDVKHLALLHPPFTGPDTGIDYVREDEDIDSLYKQGFSWRPNGVLFELECEHVWLSAYKTENLGTHLHFEATKKAILVPLEVPKSGYLNVCTAYSHVPIRISSGQYKVLFQLRTMPFEEWSYIEKYAVKYKFLLDYLDNASLVELCTMLFVPTQEKVEPQLLRFDSPLSHSSELVMFDEPWDHIR